ncbi:MAG: hypothetical protein PUC32_01715 [Oscillospiraceae bacterium]|nr:hypothetical protein [Oscillospiraceae bacterium]
MKQFGFVSTCMMPRQTQQKSSFGAEVKMIVNILHAFSKIYKKFIKSGTICPEVVLLDVLYYKWYGTFFFFSAILGVAVSSWGLTDAHDTTPSFICGKTPYCAVLLFAGVLFRFLSKVFTPKGITKGF